MSQTVEDFEKLTLRVRGQSLVFKRVLTRESETDRILIYRHQKGTRFLQPVGEIRGSAQEDTWRYQININFGQHSYDFQTLMDAIEAITKLVQADAAWKDDEWPDEGRVVDDGLGNKWGPCFVCGSTMQVVRPGKAQCPKCD